MLVYANYVFWFNSFCFQTQSSPRIHLCRPPNLVVTLFTSSHPHTPLRTLAHLHTSIHFNTPLYTVVTLFTISHCHTLLHSLTHQWLPREIFMFSSYSISKHFSFAHIEYTFVHTMEPFAHRLFSYDLNKSSCRFSDILQWKKNLSTSFGVDWRFCLKLKFNLK